MKKIKLIVLAILLVIICSSCKVTYTVTYENDNFSEEVVIDGLSSEEQAKFSRFDDPFSLKIDDDNSYTYKNAGERRVFSYDMGDKLQKTPLLKYCFEKIYIVDEKDYIHVETGGKYYCSDFDVVLKIKTDKKVLDSNASSDEDGVYTWDNLKDGVNVQISKQNVIQDSDVVISKRTKDLLIRLAIVIVFIIVIVFMVIYIKRRNGDE